MEIFRSNQIKLEAPFNEEAEGFRARFNDYLSATSLNDKNIQERAVAFHSIAQSYLMEGRINEAESNFQIAVELYRNTNDLFSLITCLSQYALILRHRFKVQESESVLCEVIRLSKALNIKPKDVKNWFLKCYFLNLLEVFDQRQEAVLLRTKLKQEWLISN